MSCVSSHRINLPKRLQQVTKRGSRSFNNQHTKMELRTLMVTMEMVIIAIFVAVMFGYIFANSEGIDLYLQTYSADMAIIINTMLSGSNEMELTYQMPSGYNAEIKNNEVCVYYQQPPVSGIRSFMSTMYQT